MEITAAQVELSLPGEKRPTSARGIDRSILIAKVGEILTTWESGCGDDPDNLIEMAKDVVDHWEDDGYQLAKMLEDTHYLEPDAELVEALQEVSFLKNEALRASVASWVNDNAIVCPFSIGSMVKVRGIDGPGEVYEIDAKQAKCSVRFECLGHVKEGLGTHGRILRYEEMEVVC